MKTKRLELQKLLETLLGSNQVYYQPPSKTKLKYPAIRYTKTNIQTIYANNANYLKNTSYELTYIDKMPDSPVIDKLLDLPYIRFGRHYVSDGLNHYTFTLYY